MKYPRRLVHKDHPQAFGIVGFEAFDHEFDGPIILDDLMRGMFTMLS